MKGEVEMKVKNLTNHIIRIYEMSAVRAERYKPDEFRLIPGKEQEILKEIPQNEYPVSVHFFPGNDSHEIVHGIPIRKAKSYSIILDPLPVLHADDEIYVVSTQFAQAAQAILPPEVVDLLFVPGEKVVNENGEIIGTLSLRKFSSYFWPSVYEKNCSNLTILSLAINFWKQNANLLSYFECFALQNLEEKLKKGEV